VAGYLAYLPISALSLALLMVAQLAARRLAPATSLATPARAPAQALAAGADTQAPWAWPPYSLLLAYPPYAISRVRKLWPAAGLRS